MVGVEIAVNGKRRCIAGMPEGVVTATVATVRHRRKRRAGRSQRKSTESALLTVSGYSETATAHQHAWWVSPNSSARLAVGDTVTFRIVDVGRPDKPRARYSRAKPKPEYWERREYLRLKRKYGKGDGRRAKGAV